jgi:hypothetical protein
LPKFKLRVNRVTKKQEPIKRVGNLKNGRSLTEHESHLRDVVAHGAKLRKKQGATNQEIKKYLNQCRHTNEITERLIPDPTRHSQRRLLKKLKKE